MGEGLKQKFQDCKVPSYLNGWTKLAERTRGINSSGGNKVKNSRHQPAALL